jgi:hypothetical protein
MKTALRDGAMSARWGSSFLLPLLAVTLMAGMVFAQTNPAAFELSTGSYTFTGWSASGSAGTYPDNMRFHQTATQDPGLAVAMTADYTGAYNGTSGTRMNGLEASGFSFINTGTNGFLGAAVVALDVSGRQDVQVSWKGGTVTPAAADRVYAIRLQYRIGTGGTWTDVSGPIEYTSSATAGDSILYGPTTLPADVNGQSVVQVRWKYYAVSGTSGARPQLRVDDITISSSPSAATATRLAIAGINGGVSPSVNTAFDVVVLATNESGTPTNVTSNTGVTLSRATGTGTLSGTLTGTITAGTNSVTISGVLYNIAETGVSIIATRTSGDVLSPGTSTTFAVLEAATSLSFVGVPSLGQRGVALTAFFVEARRPDNLRDSNYTGSITIARQSGPGSISGTLARSASMGRATFDDIAFDQGGVYTLSASANGLSGATSGEIRIADLVQIALPRYIQGNTGTNANRIPFAYRVQLTGILPNATYRYINQFVISSDAATSNGAGNCIFVTQSGNFYRSTGPGLATAGNYGEFTTDASGTYEGWFVTEPTGNARLVPSTYIFMRIILNDGAGGTTAATRLTTADSVRVVRLDVTSSDSTGTGLRGSSLASPRDFVFVYDNITGVGRPVSGTYIESDGTANTTGNSYAAFYASNVNGVDGAFGLVLPNALPTGVRRVERRALAAGTIIAVATDADGIWPSGANTVNPSGGTTEIVLTGSDVGQLATVFHAIPGSLLYGDVPVASSKMDSVLVKNAGGDVLSINTILGSNTSAFSVAESGPVTILPGDSIFVHVTFHPASAGIHEGRVTFTHNGSTSPDTVHLEGRGVVAGFLVTPASLSFGGVPVSSTKAESLLVTNTGGTTLTISSIVSSNTASFSVAEIGPVAILPGDSTFVHVTFHPATAGLHEGRVTFTHNGSTSPDTVHVSGSGVVASISIMPLSLVFGAVQVSTSKADSVVVRNTGGATLSISSIVSNNLPEFNVTETGPVEIPSGDSTRIHVAFHPTSAGEHAGRIIFTHNGGTSPDTVPVQGRGVQLTGLLPEYIEGINGTNANRIPFAYRARLVGLVENATYRFINQIVISSDLATANGAGNCIFASSTGDFVRTSSPGLATAGNYGTFTTDSTGTFEGWFVTEPTGNARFVPGKSVFIRIALNDGGSGTTVATRVTAADSVHVVKLDTASSDSTGTGLRCTTLANAKDFVFVYDNVAGNGRPLSGTFIESDGTANTTANNYALFYANNVDGVNGAFGLVLPNALPNGVRRVERRSLSTGELVAYAFDADGIWPSGANTVNPTGGTTEIVLTGADLGQLITDVIVHEEIPERFELMQNYPNPFNPATRIPYSVRSLGFVSLKVYDVLGREVATLVNEAKSPGSYEVTWDASNVASGVYLYQLKVGGFVATKKFVLLH